MRCIDLHAAGEPARVVIEGVPEIEGNSMLEKRHELMTKHDSLRKILLQEPRGYPCQNANIIFPSLLPDVAFGYVILEQNKIYPLMSGPIFDILFLSRSVGHNTICVVTALIQSGRIDIPYSDEITSHEFKLEAPAGVIPIRARCCKKKVLQVTLRNTPSYVRHHNVVVKVPILGEVVVDIVYSGMWYCVVDLSKLSQETLARVYSLSSITGPSEVPTSLPPLAVRPSNGKLLCRIGEMIKVACREQYPVIHEEFDYRGCDILVFMEDPILFPTSQAADVGIHRRNTVVMSNGELDWNQPDTWTGMLDRSPCGTGTAAVMAKLYHEGILPLHQEFIHESIVGTKFIGRLIDVTQVGIYSAVVPEISGRAYITQHCEIVVDDDDPFPEGYTVGDIWC